VGKVKLLLSRHKGCSKRRVPWLDRRAVARLKQAAESLPPQEARVDIVVADDAFVRELNRVYRGIDRPTDVLSFSYSDEPGGGPAGDNAAGEIYVSWETVDARARSQGVPPEHLFLRVGVHGLLHVAGHVHAARAEAERMEAEERRLLSRHLTPPEVEELF
jgi:probable rRNA maturation factor